MQSSFGIRATSLLVCIVSCAASLAADSVPINGRAATLAPQNTKIDFVCAHAGPKPDPRKGGFAKFSGQAQVDVAAGKLQSISFDIDATSLWTEFDMLTSHLKSPDFFDVRRFPTAKFESTSIEGSASAQITGKLTLHGVTKEIRIPATVDVRNSALSLSSEFTIDRSEFGITFDPKKVENKVSLTVVVGEKTKP